MGLIKNCLIVGGGIGGMCAAIELAKRGVEVELVEINPDWNAAGAGITLGGATLRALRQVGVVDEVLAHGGYWSEIDICAADGTVLRTNPLEHAVGAEDLPAASGILRPALADILRRATESAGVKAHAGVTFNALTQDETGVDVGFTDGGSGRYDLVIGADGVNSKVREAIFQSVPAPRFTGQGSWRAIVPRTRRNSTILMGETAKAGLNPVSDTQSYLFLLEKRAGMEFLDVQTWPHRLAGLLEEFGGVVNELREKLQDGADLSACSIVYRPLAGLIVPGPWHRGRVVLLGDAVHATTPHLAMGAGIAVEGAVVLAAELCRCHSLEGALISYVGRRYDRARLVVSSSQRLGEIEQHGGSREEHYEIMSNAMHELTLPI